MRAQGSAWMEFPWPCILSARRSRHHMPPVECNAHLLPNPAKATARCIALHTRAELEVNIWLDRGGSRQPAPGAGRHTHTEL